MKKFATVLITMLTVISLAACGGEKESTENDSVNEAEGTKILVAYFPLRIQQKAWRKLLLTACPLIFTKFLVKQ